MKMRFMLAVVLGVSGCTSPSNRQEDAPSKITAVVGRYEEQVVLCPPSKDRRFVTRMVIVAPVEREGRLLDIVSSKPLSPQHPFRQKGRILTLSIQDLDEGRGTSLIPAEGITRIIYTLELGRVRSIEEPPIQPPVPMGGNGP